MKLFILFSITTTERNASYIFLQKQSCFCISYSITLNINTDHTEVWSCLYSWPNFTEFQFSGSTGYSCGNCLIWGYIGNSPLNFGYSAFALYKCSAILQRFLFFFFSLFDGVYSTKLQPDNNAKAQFFHLTLPADLHMPRCPHI